MSRRYTDEDKARVIVVLATNNNNVYRTAKDMGIPRETIKKWNADWKRDGIPEHLLSLSEQAATGYLFDAERLRDKALRVLESKVDEGDVNTKDLYTMFGILDDKITRARSLTKPNKTETTIHMPDLKELTEKLGSYVMASVEAAQQRKIETIQADAKQAIQYALPSGEPKKE